MFNERQRCKRRVLIPGMNFARFRQCSRMAIEGAEFCKQHDPDKPRKQIDPVAERRKHNLWVAELKAKRMYRKTKER